MLAKVFRFGNSCGKRLLKPNSRSFSEYSRNTIIDPSIGLTEEQTQLQDMAHQFAVNEFRPNMREWDENHIFPLDQLRRAAKLGFGGLYTPSEKGGTGLTRLDTSIVMEALSQGCVSTTALISIHNMVCAMIAQFGNDKQISKYVPDLVSMEKVGAYCLTEPNSGSDAAALQTKAVKQKDYYICMT